MIHSNDPLEIDLNFAAKLQLLTQRRIRVFDGDTNRTIRINRFRKTIIALQIQNKIFDREETYAQFFERTYGENLRKTDERSNRQNRSTVARSTDDDRHAVAE